MRVEAALPLTPTLSQHCGERESTTARSSYLSSLSGKREPASPMKARTTLLSPHAGRGWVRGVGTTPRQNRRSAA
jgi:hypothetical protein